MARGTSGPSFFSRGSLMSSGSLKAIVFGATVFILQASLPSLAQTTGESKLIGDFGGNAAIFTAASYSLTSEHILIGMAQSRKITQFGIGFDYSLKKWSKMRLSCEGSLVPLFLEMDPVLDGVSSTNGSGGAIVTLFPEPYRPVNPAPSGYFTVPTANGNALIFGQAIYGPRQSTYAFAALPVGVRLTAAPRSRIQPSFCVNLGALYASRNIPVNNTSSFNFLAYAGPGVEIFFGREHSARIEYLYEHLSNAELGLQNPGVDSATFRLTFAWYR